MMMFAALAIGVLAAFSACSSEPDPGEGTISGEVTIGPLCPVEPCEGVENPYVGRTVIISKDDVIISTYALDESGTFSGPLASSDYIMNMEPCDEPGCAGVLPQKVTIRKDQNSPVIINVDTGIR